MQMLLQILGGICLFAMVTVVIGFVVFRYKFRKFAQDIGDLGDLQVPAELNLQPRTDVAWSDPTTATKHADDLMLHGFQSDGLYAAAEMPKLFIHGFVNPARDLFAAVYDHPAGILVVDIVQKTMDGRTVTATNAPRGGEMDSMPGKTSVRLPGSDVAALMIGWEENRLEGPNLPAEPGSFKNAFESSYREEMTWRITRGGPTSEEIRRVAALDGETLTPEMEEMMLQMKRREANGQLHEILQTKFLKESGVSGLEWDNLQHEMVIVHDNLLPEEVTDMLVMAVDDDRDTDFLEDDEEEEDSGPGFELPDLPARDAFAAVNATFSRQFTLRWQCDDPIAADFYVLSPR